MEADDQPPWTPLVPPSLEEAAKRLEWAARDLEEGLAQRGCSMNVCCVRVCEYV